MCVGLKLPTLCLGELGHSIPLPLPNVNVNLLAGTGSGIFIYKEKGWEKLHHLRGSRAQVFAIDSQLEQICIDQNIKRFLQSKVCLSQPRRKNPRSDRVNQGGWCTSFSK